MSLDYINTPPNQSINSFKSKYKTKTNFKILGAYIFKRFQNLKKTKNDSSPDLYNYEKPV